MRSMVSDAATSRVDSRLYAGVVDQGGGVWPDAAAREFSWAMNACNCNPARAGDTLGGGAASVDNCHGWQPFVLKALSVGSI